MDNNMYMFKDLVIDCKNCIHCEFHKAYESCELRTQNRIIYNHKKEAENCGYYKQTY